MNRGRPDLAFDRQGHGIAAGEAASPGVTHENSECVKLRCVAFCTAWFTCRLKKNASPVDKITLSRPRCALHQLKLQRRSLFQRLLALSVFLRECNAHSRIDGLPASNNPTRTPLATCPRWRILDTCRNKYHRRRYICALVRSDPYRFTRTIGLIMAGSVRMTTPSLHTRGHQCCQDRKQKGINASNLFLAFDPIRNG